MDKDNLKRWHKRIRIILIIIPILTFIWLVNKNLVPSGKLSANYNLQELSPYISRLYPAGRVLGVEQSKNGDYYQSIVIDPVYFKVYLPVSFERAKIILKFQTNKVNNLRLGYQIGPDFQYYFKNVVPIKREGGWLMSEVDFNLANAYIKDNKLKFAISSPRLDETEGEIKINSIQVVLEKEPLTIKDVLMLIKKFVKKIL
ncbi:MAG: hypothetical protein V1892_01470 [bacterium]